MAGNSASPGRVAIAVTVGVAMAALGTSCSSSSTLASGPDAEGDDGTSDALMPVDAPADSSADMADVTATDAGLDSILGADVGDVSSDQADATIPRMDATTDGSSSDGNALDGNATPEGSSLDGADDATDAVHEIEAGCPTGASRCTGQQPQTCSAGSWEDAGPACSNQTCSGGACIGVCAPNQSQCMGDGVQTCQTDGAWGSAVGCSVQTPVCANGACMALSADGGAVTPPSCQTSGAGTSNCGPGGGGVESCCTSLEVPGGTFYRAYVVGDAGVTGEASPATVSSFRLDKYEVTVGRFRQYVDYLVAGGSPPAAGAGKHTHLNGGQGLRTGAGYETGWNVATNGAIPSGADAGAQWGTYLTTTCESGPWTWTPSPGANENLPLTCVSWLAAYAFCAWDEGFLPSEAEWEYAAAGGTEQRLYAWGSTDPGTTGQYAIYWCMGPDAGPCSGMSAEPVGSAPLGAGLWGQLDLDGNAEEWVLDWVGYRSGLGGYPNPSVDYANLTPDEFYRGIRGGSFAGGTFYLPVSLRDGLSPLYTTAYLGFRCARTP